MQSKTGFQSSHQLKSYVVAPKSRLKLAARCPVSSYWPSCFFSTGDVDVVMVLVLFFNCLTMYVLMFLFCICSSCTIVMKIKRTIQIGLRCWYRLLLSPVHWPCHPTCPSRVTLCRNPSADHGRFKFCSPLISTRRVAFSVLCSAAYRPPPAPAPTHAPHTLVFL